MAVASCEFPLARFVLAAVVEKVPDELLASAVDVLTEVTPEFAVTVETELFVDETVEMGLLEDEIVLVTSGVESATVLVTELDETPAELALLPELMPAFVVVVVAAFDVLELALDAMVGPA